MDIPYVSSPASPFSPAPPFSPGTPIIIDNSYDYQCIERVLPGGPAGPASPGRPKNG